MLVRLALAVVCALACASAQAAPRSVEVSWSYLPGGAPFTGVALYHAASLAEINAGLNVTRVDLGLPEAGSDGITRLLVDGFDDQRDYYLVLRVYDASGAESPASRVGLIAATAPTVPPTDPNVPTDPNAPSTPSNAGPPLGESFNSYRAGQDPDGWEDSASGSTATGDPALFETAELADGTIAYGTTSSTTDIHSHFLTAVARDWTSYEYSGRMMSDTLNGDAGVTVLSQFPTALAYYRLSRTGAGPFSVSVRGGGQLVCAATPSTGVSAQAGTWMRFRVRVTRFDGRNRIRAMVYPDGTVRPASWLVDCWDLKATTLDSGSVGIYASAAPGSYWDDLQVVNVAADGAPDAYQPTTPVPTPPPTTGYTSRNSLVHCWMPGRDTSSLGRDFATRGVPVDVAADAKGLSSKDIGSPGTAAAFVDLDGSTESLGNKDLPRYGIGDTWSLAAWVRPDAGGRSKSRYLLDLNGEISTRSKSRISLMLDSSSRFAIEVSDASGRVRALPAAQPIAASSIGQRWYYVVAVKASGGSLTIYVDGRLAARTDVGVPLQGDVPRTLRVGTRVKDGSGYGFAGGVGAIALWNAPLGAAEVQALYANGNRGFDPR